MITLFLQLTISNTISCLLQYSINIKYIFLQYHRNKPDKIFFGMASNILKHAIILFRMYIDWLIDLIFGFYWEGKRVKIPDLEKRHSILTESAVDIAAKIRNKQLKSEDLVKICIERIQQVSLLFNLMVSTSLRLYSIDNIALPGKGSLYISRFSVSLASVTNFQM